MYIRVNFKIFFFKYVFIYKISVVENEWYNKYVIICFVRFLKDFIFFFVLIFIVCGCVDKLFVCFINDIVGYVVIDILFLVILFIKK